MIILAKNEPSDYTTWIEQANSDGAMALIDKQAGWTSFDVVAKLRRLTHIKKIGHAGTLDPFATGLLILCLGKATKQIFQFQDMTKKYSGMMKLGAVTDTYDPESEEKDIKDVSKITNEEIIAAANDFVGDIMQVPPAFSAKKINGQPVYKLARRNIQFELKPVPVSIYNLSIIEINKPFVKFEVECSKGTYIRSLAKDIGDKLGCGAYLTELRRLKIGEYSVAQALSIQEIQQMNVETDLVLIQEESTR